MDHSPAFLALCEEARSKVREISPDAAAAESEQGKAILIDVREDHEVSQGSAAKSIHLGRGIIERDIEKRVPSKSQRLILYCGGGFRSALAADNLQKMGYSDVWSMQGGWKAWKSRGLPVK